MDEERHFDDIVRRCKIPTLVLDQKWHRLFAISGKPEEVKVIEQQEKELLLKQSHLATELKNLRKIKSDLMKSIVENMEGKDADKATEAQKLQLEQDKRLIDETNDKISEDEDLLKDIPREISDINRSLMLATMNFCYAKLRTNAHEISDIAQWIANIRVELKKNIIKKQNREINNKEIYAYMHDIFGPDVMDMFDVKNEESFVPPEDATKNVDGMAVRARELREDEVKEANKDRQENFEVKD